MSSKHATSKSASSFSLVDETAIDTHQPELIFTREQFENIDPQFRRRLAAELDTDSVNGKSTRLEIGAALAVQRTLSEFE